MRVPRWNSSGVVFIVWFDGCDLSFRVSQDAFVSCGARREVAGRFRVERGAAAEFGWAGIVDPRSAALFVERWLMYCIRADRRRLDGNVNELEVLTIVFDESGSDRKVERLCRASIGQIDVLGWTSALAMTHYL